MENQQTLEILAFTDPVCTWCWGAEPVLRELQVGYGDQVRIRPVMGGLVEDIRAFYDSANAIGGDPERSNAQIAAHWLEASGRHGMPVRAEGFRLFTAEVVSTYPQNIAVKAAELTAPALGARYLRRLREASAAEARETGRREVLIETLSEGVLQWRAPIPDAAGLLGFLRTFGRAAPVELTTVFDLSPADLERLLAGLEAAGDIRRVAAGQGVFLGGHGRRPRLRFSDRPLCGLTGHAMTGPDGRQLHIGRSCGRLRGPVAAEGRSHRFPAGLNERSFLSGGPHAL